MLDATLSGKLFTRPDEGGVTLDFSPLENVSFQHEAAINSVDFDALTNNLVSISATEFVWQDDNATLTLSGSGITPVSSAEDLEAAINNGTANGTLNALSLDVGGTEVLRLDISSSMLTLISGNHRIDLAIDIPPSLSALLDLADISFDLAEILEQSESEFQDTVNALAGYGVSGVSFSDDQTQLLGLSFGGDTFASLSVLGFVVAIEGSVPNDFSGLLTAIKAINDADGDIAASSEVLIDGFSFTSPEGEKLIEVLGDGTITSEDDISIDEVTILGTAGDDEGISLDDYWVERDQEEGGVVSGMTLGDIRDLTGGDAPIKVELGAGDDWLTTNTRPFVEHYEYSNNERSISLDGGADYDTLYVYNQAGVTSPSYRPVHDYNGARLDVEGFDFDAYEAAATQAASDLGLTLWPDFNPESTFENQDSINAYYERINQRDFYAPEVVDIDLAEGTMSITKADGDSDGEYVAMNVSFENFERISLDGDGAYNVVGSEGEDRVRIHSLNPDFIEVDGAGGQDRLEFDRTWIDREAGERGLTQDAFLEMFDLAPRVDGSIDISFADSEELFINMSNVEEIRFAIGDDSETVEVASLFNGLALLGTEEADTLNGSSGDDTVSALGSADYISGNGGNDLVDAGGGDDIISLLDGVSTVDGGEGYDSLRVTGFVGERIDINFATVEDVSSVQVTAFDLNDGTLGSVSGKSIERVGVGFDGDISVTGDDQDNTIKLVSAPSSLEFVGGAGTDELQFHELTLTGDLTEGTTQDEFYESFRLVAGDEEGITEVESRSSGDELGAVRSVESFRFATDDGFETVSFDDLTIYEEVATVEDAPTVDLAAGDIDQTYTTTEDGQTVSGGAGEDDLNGNVGSDNLDGGDDNDNVDGGGGDDVVTGGEGEDTVGGGVGDDVVNGGDGNDTVDGGAGQDEVNGGDGDDLLLDVEGGEFDGGAGNDTAIAQSGNNTFEEDDNLVVPASNQINDFYCGGYGNDDISTGAGNDILIGDANSLYFFGSDRLDGGTGIDLLQGGGNADVFVFEAGDTTAGGQDIIGKFDLNDIFNEWANYPNDDINNISASGADFQIGLDTVELSGFDAVEAAILANLDDFLADTTEGAVFAAAGVEVLFAGIAEADLLAVDVNDVFVFV